MYVECTALIHKPMTHKSFVCLPRQEVLIPALSLFCNDENFDKFVLSIQSLSLRFMATNSEKKINFIVQLEASTRIPIKLFEI